MCGTLVLAGLLFFDQGDSHSQRESCRAAKILYDQSDVIEHEGRTLLTGQHPNARERCGPNQDLALYGLSGTPIEGIIWDDCLVSWRNGGRTTASDIGYPCLGV